MRFEGAPPEEAETAAIIAVLEMLHETPAHKSGAPSAWQLSARLPDVEIDEIRALARSGGNVF